MELEINTKFLRPLLSTASLVDLIGGRGRGATHLMAQHALTKMLGVDKSPRMGAWGRLDSNVARKQMMDQMADIILRHKELRHLFHFRNDSILHVKNGNVLYSVGFDRKSPPFSIHPYTSQLYLDDVDEFDGSTYMRRVANLVLNLPRRITGTMPIMPIMRSFNPPGREHFLNKNWYRMKPVGNRKGYSKPLPKKIAGFESYFATYKDNGYLSDAYKQIEKFGNPEHPEYNLDWYNTRVLGLVHTPKKVI